MVLQGSRNAALLFLVSSVLLFIQAGINAAILDDWLGTFVSGSFAFIMLIVVFMAYKGGLAAVMHQTITESGSVRTITTQDTGQRVQPVPCCGICAGIGIIAVIFIFIAEAIGDLLPFVLPGLAAGIVSILAAIVFALEYKGPWTAQAY